MKVYINRAKALLLVGTISAGCASSNDDEGPGIGGAAGAAGAGDSGAGSGGTTSAGGSGQGGGGAGSGGTPSAGGSAQGGGGTGGTPSAGGSSQSGPDAGNPDAGNPDAGDSDGPDAGGDAGGDGGTLACDDTADSVVSCSGLEPTECDGLEGFLSSECEMIAFIMKPAPANAARNCMIALEPPELCVTTNTHACIVAALESSCPDPEADDECTAIGAVCDDSLPAFSACSSALSGMTQLGRDQMVTCMTEVSCDLFACIEGLDF